VDFYVVHIETVICVYNVWEPSVLYFLFRLGTNKCMTEKKNCVKEKCLDIVNCEIN